MTDTYFASFPAVAAWLEQHLLLGIILLIWIMAWKGFALWKAAGLRQKYWFAALFILNTFGILEIIYLAFVARKYEVEVVES